MRKLQKSTEVFIRKLPFQHLVRETAQNVVPCLRVQSSAVEALQQASEAYLVEILEEANLCAVYAKRGTLMARDLWLSEPLGTGEPLER